ncbi:MAG: DUF58 domain-containing protein [Candidatus Sumerlaeota bacterium]
MAKTERQAWIEDPDLFMAVEDLELVARGVVEGALHGLHRSPYIGFSSEFDSHREYQPGDDLRHVNWNLWARSDRLYVKQYKSDTNLNLYILLDSSGPMLTDHGPTEKWKYGARAAAALAFLALSGRDATGAYLLESRVEHFVAPKVRPGQLADVLTLLQNANPSASPDPSARGDIGQALDEARQLCKRRGIVILISDLFDKEEAILRGLNNLRYMGHEVIVMQVLDPWEVDLPEEGQYAFRDLETGEEIQTHPAEVRNSYRRLVEEWRDGFRKHCEDTGIDWVSCTTEEPLRKLLVDYLLKRSRMY